MAEGVSLKPMDENDDDPQHQHVTAFLIGLIPALLIVGYVYVVRNPPAAWASFRPGDIRAILYPTGILLALASLVSFVVNIVFPAARKKKDAIILATPSIITIALLFVVSFLSPNTQDDFDYGGLWSIVYWFQAVLCCATPMGILLTLNIAYFGWLGARLNQKLKARPPKKSQ